MIDSYYQTCKEVHIDAQMEHVSNPNGLTFGKMVTQAMSEHQHAPLVADFAY
jgi:hypothetical protein